MKITLLIGIFFTFYSCSNFKAERVDSKKGDELALNITDKWLHKDTEDTVKELLNKIEHHRSFIDYLRNEKKKQKIFVAEIQNETSEPYFPIQDINDELLNEFSAMGKFTLIDSAARSSLLKEIQYQNDGMVDPKHVKTIGKQFGADLLIFGSVRMQPETRDGKTIKQYSINLRMTNLETSEEVLRVGHKMQKYSEQAKSVW